MPKYDYFCGPCNNSLEVERSIFAEEVPPECVGCEKPMKRDYSPTPAHFKGLGWAKLTEYKPKGS